MEFEEVTYKKVDYDDLEAVINKEFNLDEIYEFPMD